MDKTIEKSRAPVVLKTSDVFLVVPDITLLFHSKASSTAAQVLADSALKLNVRSNTAAEVLAD